MKFPKITIKKGRLVTFKHKYAKEVHRFGYRNLSIKENECESVRDFAILGHNINDYTMSTSREINISITF